MSDEGRRSEMWRGEIVHESELTRVARLVSAGGAVVRKEPLGPSAPRRLRHELAILERLRGVDGVARLVEAPRYPGSIVLADAGDTTLAGLAKPLAVGDLIGLAVKLARAVAGMHRRGVLHRDIAPANVVISQDGAPCLVDFALATSLAEIRPEFTHHTEIVGTLAYLAPEQTGRTGRPVDQRADLYSLGATLYELATGAPPFGSADPLRLTHDHLARVPVPPAAVNPAVPGPLSDVIMHLLEKEPDNRYQTADGVVHDLERLRDAGPRAAAELRVGERDVPPRLSPPSRLAGRDAEVAALRAAFEDALAGRCRGVLVGGAAGVGKTALVNELRPVVTGRDGWFVAGKFDQYRRDLESDAVQQAFRALGRLLLAEPEDELARIRERILTAVGPNAGLLTAVVPEFAALLEVPPHPGDPLTAQVRAQRSAMQVLRAIASPQRPVVVFVDDLQWAGRTPLGFVDVALSEEPIEGLLLVGAYRQDDVDAVHSLAAALSRWREQPSTRHLRLGNLPMPHLVTMVAEMLHVDKTAAADLAGMISPHTSGNPYETVELLNALRRDGALTAAAGGWWWDAAAVRAYLGRPEVAGLLGPVPAPSWQLVEAMACLGGRAELRLLGTATAVPANVVEQRLAPALDEGLLSVEAGAQEAVRFRHDRIREAVLRGLDRQRRRGLQLAMARRLAEVPEWFAIAAEQYLPVVDEVHDPTERRRVLGLLRRAVDQAALIGDHALVNALLTAALQLIDPGETATLMEVHTGRHAALYGLGRLDEADEEYHTITGLCTNVTDRVDATVVQIRSLTHRNRLAEAIGLGTESLRELGITVPAADRLQAELDHRLDRSLRHLHRWLDDTDSTDEMGPEITDPTLLATARLLNTILPAAYVAPDFALCRWLSLEALEIWLKHGLCPTLLATASHVASEVVMLGDYGAGYRALRRSLALAEARGYEPDTSQTGYRFAYSCCWFEPVENAVRAGLRAREGLIAAGDLGRAGYTYYTVAVGLLDSTPTLDSFVAEVETGLAFVRRTGSERVGQWLDTYRWLAAVLRGEGAAAADEAAADGHVDPFALFHAHVNHALAAAVLDDPVALARHTAAAMPLLPTALGLYPTALAHLLRGLALAAQARDSHGDERDDLLSELEEATRWLAARAADAPANFQPLLRLLEAERAWAVGDFRSAALAFDAARHEAAQRQRPWHRALITERAARFYLAHGLEHGGYSLLMEAREKYLAWGATAKVRQLDWAYPTLRPQPDATAAPGGDQSSGQPDDVRHQRATVTTGALDLLGILSASQALSSETSIGRLHTRVARLLSAMTGATAVNLPLWSDERQHWLLPTPGSGGTARLCGTAQEPLVPMSVLRYAQRMREPLVVPDATRDDRFARDPYFTGVTCCSLLAVPILSRGTLQAVLLLENRLIRGAFTTERLDGVKLIAGQLAVSLDNAQLYAEFRRIADEQAALRRVATLVARGVGPDPVFAAVAEEVATLFDADGTAIVRFEPDGDATVMGDYGFERSRPGARGKPHPDSAMAAVQATGRAARRDVDDPESHSLPDAALPGLCSAVASPILVEGRVWGAMDVGSRRERLPQDTEQRLADFTELIATAIANADSQAELTISRARLVATADQIRRRIERDLHDGAQQRLVALALQLRAAQAALPPELDALATELDRAVTGAAGALDELREISRGIHPAILSEGGLGPALRSLARRSPIPVDLDIRTQRRLPEQVEVSAYYVVAEALTNAAKHAHASAVTVTVEADTADTAGAVLRLAVRDDGVGGADFARGTGLVGLKDRVEALGGRIVLHSPRGEGTSLRVELPG
ncbi:AAA family ATPase [Dactylosporangium fulvum]|uniref:AAA family ATPase n=1 Tax=Dactylosporangium fulvum TaxID=53359 RepID=A0ABY5VSW3_9ACTN|nr:AAA family ATPase [Dactylosporangium fulvum]UWP80196.1 AAA family ATPase [Dactylosporangium fulvum]